MFGLSKSNCGNETKIGRTKLRSGAVAIYVQHGEKAASLNLGETYSAADERVARKHYASSSICLVFICWTR